MRKSSSSLRSLLRASTALIGLATACIIATPADAVVINDNYTPSQIVDTTNVNGVGQMVIDLQNGYIGLCTASLINPRTVIFASHCVNESPSGSSFEPGSGYGAAFGGLPIGFFFNANNNQSGNSAIGHWLYGVGGGASYLTRTSENAYNSNYVVYDTQSTDLGLGYNFLQADIAMAALDTPATTIPTWTLLFSPLTAATHATITGYGKNGIGTTGASGGIDFRRRSAENIISFLGSLDDQDTFLFGNPDGLPQNLYMMDFNDPKFGTAQANMYDFNIFHDAATPKEGITAPGDSGGPLIVDQLYAQKVIAAVLSGGDRFWGAQPSSSYGTTSFYQPLYLFWDWIVANNPYKYVSAKSGDGSWTDPTHWVIDLDPNYVTASGTTLTNALPTTPAQGVPTGSSVNSPKFGNVCYFNYCYDIATGITTVYSGTQPTSGTQAGSSQLASSPAIVSTSVISGSDSATSTSGATTAGGPVGSILSSQTTPAEGSALVNGVSIQGAPGSSDFVPNDTDGNPSVGAPARYYDVTLSASGTTTLSGAAITIDRLTINGAGAGLTIASSGSLATLIDTTVYAGNLRVDGGYVSVGDIAMMGGVMSGTGTVTAPNTTFVLGAVAPGGVGTTGTLTVNGNVIFASGSGFLADVSSTGSDLLDVYGTTNLGGTLVVTPIGGYVPKYHDQKTILYSDTITGSFASVPDYIPGILYPSVTTVTIGSGPSAYQAEIVTFQAGSYAALSGLTPDQAVVAAMLDGSRGYYSSLSSLYDAIDPTTDGTTLAALSSLVPNTARVLPQVTQLLDEVYTNSLWSYIGGLSHGGDGKVAVQTGTLKLVENSQVGSVEMRSLLSNLGQQDTGGASANAPVAPNAAEGGAMALPKGWGGFLNGQAINGSVKIADGSKADVDGWLVSLGVDMPATERFRAGISFSFGEVDGNLRSQPAMTKTSMKQAVLYGQYDTSHGFYVNGFFGGSLESVNTNRDVLIGTTVFNVRGHSRGSSALFGLQVGTVLDDIAGGEVRPAAGVQYARPTVNGFTETGSSAALKILPVWKEETDLRIGFDADWNVDLGDVVAKPDLHLFLVHAATSTNGGVETLLAAAPGNPYTFTNPTDHPTWAEIGLGTAVDVYDNVTLGFHFNSNVGRADTAYTAYSGSLKVTF